MKIYRALDTDLTLNRSGSYTDAKLIYYVDAGTEGDCKEKAIELVRNTAPQNIGNILRRDIKLIGVKSSGIYEFEVIYELPTVHDYRKSGDRQWSFEISCRRTRVFEAAELVQTISGKDDQAAPDPGTMLMWDGRFGEESAVGGCYAWIPEMSEKCIATYRESAITANFRKNAAAAAGKTNAEPFHGWERGEVLLIGAEQGSCYENRLGTKLVDVTYTFAIRRRGIRQFGDISVEIDSPWNVWWDISRRNAVNNQIDLCGIYESRIYGETDFSVLNI